MSDVAEDRYDQAPAEVIDLKEIFFVLWNGKWFISAFTGLAALVSVWYALSLPNIYHWGFRLRFLFGRDLGGKYKFPTEPVKDRHRWITSFYSSVQFVQQNSGSMNLFVQPIVIERLGFRRVFQVLDRIGILIAPNLFAYGVFFVLQKNDSR